MSLNLATEPAETALSETALSETALSETALGKRAADQVPARDPVSHAHHWIRFSHAHH